MKYNELKIEVAKSDLETLEGVLIEQGFTAMMIDDPDDVRDILDHKDMYKYDYINDELSLGLDRKPVITLFFADDAEGSVQLKEAVRILDGCGIEHKHTCTGAGDDSEWLYKWQEHFKPARVGERIVVKPSWEEYLPAEGDLVIEMDPGMAFGSGLHETTSMCIKALEKVMAGRRDERIRVLDVGCGTGILAIAAALLGADECLGIDIDTDAVTVAAENIARNGLSDRITAQYGDLTEGIDYKADIVVANLMADLVVRLSPAAGCHLREGGFYITSGILDIKEEICREAVENAGFEVLEILKDGEWRAVIAKRR